MTTLINKLRAYILSPESWLELRLRTVYHKILSTKLCFLWQDYLAKRSYKKYRARRLQDQRLKPKPSDPQPKVTFILSVSEESRSDVQATLDSIQSLNGDHWEVFFISPQHASLPDLNQNNDARFLKAEPDYANLLNKISGEYIIFCEAGDLFHDSLLVKFYKSLSVDSPADLTYFDCEYYDEKLGSFHPVFKPSVFSPALLFSVNYLSRSLIRYQSLRRVWTDTDHNSPLPLFELEIILRLYEKGCLINHIPDVLLTQKRLVTTELPEIQKAHIEHLSRQGLKDVTVLKHETGPRFSWDTGSPTLAIIILSKNNHRFLEPLIPALVEQPYQGNFSIHIVDNGSDDPETIAYYQKVQREQNVSIIPYPKPFNYSEAINLGAAKSKSDLILFMNDDMALIDDQWLSELAQWAIRPEIGVVGPKLLRKNRTIQHAGIIMGLTGFVGHIYLNAPDHYNGLWGSVDCYRNILALTGACQMVRREVFTEVGGYDENYVLAFGDIDFCLKVHEKGYQNVYTPFAQLYHYEGSSRGYQTPIEDALKGYEEMETYLVKDDPFFSPNLTYTRIPKCMLNKLSKDERQQQIEARKLVYNNNRSPLGSS